MNSFLKTFIALTFLFLPSILSAKKEIEMPSDSGAYDMMHLRTGFWKEYKIDTTHAAYIWPSDRKRRFIYDTADVMITLNEGKYNTGHRVGEWKTYNCYSAEKPYKWIFTETVNLVNGFFDGEWKYYTYDGKVLFEKQFKAGKRNGVYREYYLNGKVKTEKHYKDDRLNGKYKTFFDSGKITREETYSNGYINGKSKQYYDNGQIRFVRVYKNGVIMQETVHKSRSGKDLELGTLMDGIGTLNLYNEGGGLYTSYTYHYGHLDGKCSVYYKTGKLMKVTHFESDTLSGKEEIFAENGTKISEATIKHGVYEGSYKFWYTNGKPWGEYVYKKGLVYSVLFLNDTMGKPLNVGTFKEGSGLLNGYDDSCRIAYSHVYLKGLKNGETFTYYKNGKVHYHNFYRNDTLQGTDSVFNNLGFLIRSGNVVDGNWEGIIKSYYYNGKIKNEELYKHGIYLDLIAVTDTSGNKIDGGTLKGGSGTFKLFSDSATTYTISEYQYGARNGKALSYFRNGSLHRELYYTNDTLDGTQKYYYPNGKLKFKYEMKMGKKYGSGFVYHENGNVWTERVYYNDFLMEVTSNFDANGAVMDKGTIADGNGTVKQYDESGKLIGTHETFNGYVPDWDQYDDE